jgi:hypothetical protein
MFLLNNNSEYLAIDFGTCNSVISLIQKLFYICYKYKKVAFNKPTFFIKKLRSTNQHFL